MKESQVSQSFANAWSNQWAVVGALLIRELQMRFGRDNIGYLWLIAEPMMLATVISSIHYVTTGAHRGMEPFPFTLVGYCLFILFRGIFNRAEGAVETAGTLFYYRMVKPFDVMLARALVEAAGCTATLIVLMSIALILGIAHAPVRPLYLFAAIVMITWWSFALSLIIAGVTYGNHTLGRFVHPISYFAVPLSGAFWTMSIVPPAYQPYLTWNPMVGIFEMARYGQFQWADDKFIYLSYQITVCSILTFIGLIIIRILQNKLHV